MHKGEERNNNIFHIKPLKSRAYLPELSPSFVGTAYCAYERKTAPLAVQDFRANSKRPAPDERRVV